MPIVKYRLEVHNDEKSMILDIEGPADQLINIVPPKESINTIADEIQIE